MHKAGRATTCVSDARRRVNCYWVPAVVLNVEARIRFGRVRPLLGSRCSSALLDPRGPTGIRGAQARWSARRRGARKGADRRSNSRPLQPVSIVRGQESAWRMASVPPTMRCRPPADAEPAPSTRTDPMPQMKLTILGASGGIGRQLVQQAVTLGHEVTALVRSSTPFDLRPRSAR